MKNLFFYDGKTIDEDEAEEIISDGLNMEANYHPMHFVVMFWVKVVISAVSVKVAISYAWLFCAGHLESVGILVFVVLFFAIVTARSWGYFR